MDAFAVSEPDPAAAFFISDDVCYMSEEDCNVGAVIEGAVCVVGRVLHVIIFL